ncbi:MAG: ABC transporter permease [Bryobacteraceae bacterium]
MWRDLQYGVRQISRKKLFSAVVILLLALGIGANTVIFSFVNALLLKRLPVHAPENLYLVQKMRVKQVRPDTSFFYRQFQAVAQGKKLFSAAIAEQEWFSGNLQPFSASDSVRLITTQIVSPNYFSELGIQAILGRVLNEADAAASSDIPVVLSYQFWASQFNRDPSIIGRKIRVKKYPFVVAGILPSEFHGIEVERAPDVRLPICAAPILTGGTVTEPAGDFPIAFQILTRLAPNVSEGQAAAAVFPAVNGMEETLWRDWYTRNSKASLIGGDRPAKELKDTIDWERSYHLALADVGRGVSQLRQQFSRAVYLLMGAVALLLLAVCANVAGLLLAKSEERKREITVRLSMGANRLQLLRQLSIENLLLAMPSVALGIALAYGAAPWLLKLVRSPLGIVRYATPPLLNVTPDARVLLFSIALSLLTVVLFGIVPARHALNIDLNEQLKGSSRQATAVNSGMAIVAIQVALSVMLFAAASIMFRTFWNLEHLNPGFDRTHVIEFNIDPWDAGYSEIQSGILLRELKQRERENPGVRAVSFASMGLMRGIGTKTTVTPQGTILPEKTFLNTSTNSVTTDYFESLGIPLMAGRNLEISDAGKIPAPIVVNRAFADFFFPHQNAVGKAVVQGVDGTKPPTAIIVGVVGTAKYRSLREQDPPIYYSVTDDKNPGGMMYERSGMMYVRTYADPARVINATRRILRRLAPNVPIIEAFTLEQEVQNSLWQERLVTILCAFFGITALLLSATGLYGALAYSVARRSRELGIRVAIGAQARHILQTVCLRMIVAVALGLLGGLLCSVAVMRLAASLVFGVRPDDPLSFVLAAAVLMLCIFFAAVPPARRATKTDPALALRAE